MPRYAAIDIGSNSVRLAVADVTAEGVKTLATDREVTRLGTSVFSEGVISKTALDHVCRTLERFRATYSKHKVQAVRAVATSAVRDARNQGEFLALAAAAIGTPVEIISGIEEARLIHSGVQTVWPHPKQRVLLIDIGGGSAEVIVGDKGKMVEATSKPLGAVRLTEIFLRNEPPRPEDMNRLNAFIDEKLAAVLKKTEPGHFDRIIGTSATAAAIISAINRVPRRQRDAADRKHATTAQVGRLLAELSSKNLAGRKQVFGIGPRRAEIIVAGTAVLYRILRTFGGRSVYYSRAGVRDGILADLAARGVGADLSHLDKDHRKIVEGMAKRFGVDLPHARKTAQLAQELFEGLKPVHGLPASAGKLLEAAAYLVDIGHYVSDIGHHKHSYYLVSNADLPAFTNEEREIVAQLCRFHRKSMPSARHTHFLQLNAANQRTILRLTPLLRLADGLASGHEQRVSSLAVELLGDRVAVAISSSADTNLEIWAGERTAEVFSQVYGKKLIVKRKPAG